MKKRFIEAFTIFISYFCFFINTFNHNIRHLYVRYNSFSTTQVTSLCCFCACFVFEPIFRINTMEKVMLEIPNGICYNAIRQNDESVHGGTQKASVLEHRSFFVYFLMSQVGTQKSSDISARASVLCTVYTDASIDASAS